MKTRDQAEAGDVDPAKTVLLDDTYRVRVARGESADSERAAHVRASSPSTEALPLNDQWRQAESDLVLALTEFKTAASAVIDRIKVGECLPKPELDREWHARLRLINARKLVERLERRRKAPQKKSG
jgi:hypothetical protein